MYRGRVAGRRVLVVLDNAVDEKQILPWLPGTPGCPVLITSRRRLTSLDHAVPVTLDVLPLADAVSLFTDFTGQAGELVLDIVRLCGQLPLAIRIAAVRLRARPSWTLAHLADRLQDHRRRLGELSAGQRGVAVAINLSYDQLEPDQQRVFRLLALHRYQFHDLVRAHATETCVATEPEPVRPAALTRLLNHYTGTATAAMGMAYPDATSRPPWSGPAGADFADETSWGSPRSRRSRRTSCARSWPPSPSADRWPLSSKEDLMRAVLIDVLRAAIENP